MPTGYPTGDVTQFVKGRIQAEVINLGVATTQMLFRVMNLEEIKSINTEEKRKGQRTKL